MFFFDFRFIYIFHINEIVHRDDIFDTHLFYEINPKINNRYLL